MLCSVVRRLGVQKTFTRLDELLSQSPSLCKIKLPISLPNIFWLNSNYLPWIQRGCCPEATLLETRQAGGGRGWGGGGGPHLGYERGMRQNKKDEKEQEGWDRRRGWEEVGWKEGADWKHLVHMLLPRSWGGTCKVVPGGEGEDVVPIDWTYKLSVLLFQPRMVLTEKAPRVNCDLFSPSTQRMCCGYQGDVQ